MRHEALSELLTLTLTRSEKAALVELAFKHGATMRGYIRSLIREAATKRQCESSTTTPSEQEANHD